ncbi:MAG: pilus assembly protein N-terminal domain-containing protein [Bacteriovoracaceae bacterium]|nr:pilus assembly protein N-terminal domain-containing protein [Bacteriovoracaceae bacterium]
MANLGVVPLLRFAAFLLEPAFFALFFLTIVVRFVHDAIKNLKFLNHSNAPVCQIMGKAVKMYCNFYRIWAPLFGFFILNVQGVNGKEQGAPDGPQVLLLAKGEMQEIPLTGKVQYSVGNKEVLRVKYLSQNHSLAIKAQALGQTEVVIWKNKKAKHILCYVISKKAQLQSAQMMDYLKDTSLRGDLKGEHIWVEGRVHDWNDFERVVAMKNFSKNASFKQVVLDSKFQSLLRTQIYENFFQFSINLNKCDLKRVSELNCYIKHAGNIPVELGQAMKEMGIKIINLGDDDIDKNFKLKLRLIQFARTDGQNLTVGVDHFQGKVDDLLNRPWKHILSANESLLSEQNTEMSLLAEPLLQLSIGQPQEIRIGTEFPFIRQVNAQTSDTSWKFAGLIIKVTLEKIHQKLRLTFMTSHTQWDGQKIQGNEGQGSVFLRAGKSGEILFQLPYEFKRKTVERMPILGSIPFLGRLFTGPNTEITKNQIWALATLKRVED